MDVRQGNETGVVGGFAPLQRLVADAFDAGTASSHVGGFTWGASGARWLAKAYLKRGVLM